jgi:endo-1,4-beta-xylanase
MAAAVATIVGLGAGGVASASALAPGSGPGGGFGGSFAPPPACTGYVGLTFDDGPTASTPALLAILSHYRATATFFDIGANMQQYPAMVTAEAKTGQVGNHSYDHPYLDELTYPQIFNELLGTNQIAQQLTGTVPVLFRPPFDRLDADVTAAQYSLGLVTALWNIDSDDYDGISAAQIAHNVWNASPGDVILFHDGLRNTLAALPTILQHFQNERLCAGELIPSATPHFAWPTQSYGNVNFYAQVVAPGTPAPVVSSLHLTPQQQSTAVGPDSTVPSSPGE